MIETSPKKLKIAMINDFVFPKTGGIETHLYSISYCLIELGHKVIWITHAAQNRKVPPSLNKGHSLPSKRYQGLLLPFLHSTRHSYCLASRPKRRHAPPFKKHSYKRKYRFNSFPICKMSDVQHGNPFYGHNEV